MLHRFFLDRTASLVGRRTPCAPLPCSHQAGRAELLLRLGFGKAALQITLHFASLHSSAALLQLSQVTIKEWFTAEAWQPLTFGGVAKFADASFARLWLVQLLFAALGAASLMLFLAFGWFPAVSAAIKVLPDEGGIRDGKMIWTTNSPVTLAENRLISLVVDLEHTGGSGQISDLQIAFGRDELHIDSLAGYTPVPYAPDWHWPMNRKELEPWWGAWRPPLLAVAGIATMVQLFINWLILASLYALPVRLLTFFADRAVRLKGCWKLCSAALLPGALVMSAGIVLYGMHQLSLVGLALVSVLHLVVGWVYVVGGIVRLPKESAAVQAAQNPFVPGQIAASNPPPEPESPTKPPPKNPFQS
jgi:hypothetical protein